MDATLGIRVPSLPRQDVHFSSRKRNGRARRHAAYCKVEKEGRLTIVTINRPEVMNALHPPAQRRAVEVFDEFAADPELWVAILTGAGDRAFSRRQRPQVHGGRRRQRRRAATGFAGITSRYDLNKPVIAAVNGVAMGGGFEIAARLRHHHRRRERAASRCPSRASASPRWPAACTACRARSGSKRAMGMMLTGRRVPAQEGYELGFVNEVVPEGQALAGRRRWAGEILECSPISVRASKQAAYEGLEQCRRGRRRCSALPAVGDVRTRGLRRGPQGVRREAPAPLEGPLRWAA